MRDQQRQEHDGNPGEGLPNGAGRNEGFAIGEPLQQLHGDELGSCSDKLGQCRQHAQLERACMKEQGEGREILFAASLRDGLAGAVSEAVAKTSLTGTLRL